MSWTNVKRESTQQDIQIVQSDSFVVMDISEELCEVVLDDDEYLDQTISCSQAFEVSPLISLEPNNHVFYSDAVTYCVGDEATFWLLWNHMRYKVVFDKVFKAGDTSCRMLPARTCFDIVKLKLSSDKSQGKLERGWACETSSRRELLIVLNLEDNSKRGNLEVRCNDTKLLHVYFSTPDKAQTCERMLPILGAS